MYTYKQKIIFLLFPIFLLGSISQANALSIEAGSSGYQITNGGTPTPTPTVSTKKTTVPVVKKNPTVPSQPITKNEQVSVPTKKNTPTKKTYPLPVTHTSAPEEKVNPFPPLIVQSQILVIKNISPLFSLHGEVLHTAPTEAPEINGGILLFLQLLSILAIAFFSFGLGFLAYAPTSRS